MKIKLEKEKEKDEKRKREQREQKEFNERKIKMDVETRKMLDSGPLGWGTVAFIAFSILLFLIRTNEIHYLVYFCWIGLIASGLNFRRLGQNSSKSYKKEL